MKTILVVANETLGGTPLVERVQSKIDAGEEFRAVFCIPRTNPRHGNVIYDDAVYDAAQVRVDLARAYLRERGIDSIGEVGDPDPYTATMDAIAEHHPDEIIVATHPATSSGWLRRDLIERIADASGLPVDHVVVDLEREGRPFAVTLVVANRTASRDELVDQLRQKFAEGGDRIFIAVVPQEGGEGVAVKRAQARLSQLVDRIREAGLRGAGMIGDPDPYTATMNALQFFHVDDIVVSTLPATRSGWLRADLIERVRKATGLPVEHVESSVAAPAVA
ncbi:hypothetical protein GKE82_23060 [Conexibacter sp. W3-3-2]|uniref:Universal stress protein n=1 Tax=Paraconexibacter algicola TaxID=2133960 RepID=A0A2T4UF00_9ACTN|nr:MULTISPECIES: hypothetical protein [Solirubrobacterales]MTD47090.1 hypothetical protein [Conexibacter sp. W3-3-2]PTL56345.1 hypothetical protein C7Y72_15365 [Paraconexibacter algicola]